MSKGLSSPALGGAALLLAAFIFGTFGILIRAMDGMFGVAAQGAVRFGLALLILLGFNLLTRRLRRIPRIAFAKIILLGFAFSGLILLFTYAVNETKISTSVSLQYAGTIITSLFVGRFIFKEKISRYKVAALILAGVGLAVYGKGMSELTLGLVAAFTAGIFDGIAHGLRKSLGSYNISRTLQLQWQYLVGVSTMCVVALFSTEPIVKEVSVSGIISTVNIDTLIARMRASRLAGLPAEETV